MSLSFRALATTATLALAPTAAAQQLTTYIQDFESTSPTDPGAIAADNWIVYGYVLDNMGQYAYGYGVFAAPNHPSSSPNDGFGFSGIGSGLGGASQGNQYLDIFSDYANGDHANGFSLESNVFIEQTIGAVDVGTTATFSFDYLKNPAVINGDGNMATEAFIKIFRSSDGSFTPLSFITVDTTNASTTTWASDSLSIQIEPDWAGETLQFGFLSRGGNYDDSSRLYDNIEFSSPITQPPGINAYSQDFEALDIADPGALTNDNWLVFANVFDPTGGYLYGYGVFGAPNGGAGFSGIATGSGGADQGAQYLNAYSDYNNGDHANGNTINALLFQEREINPVDVGKTFSFEFDYLKNPQVTNGDGATTTNAFIKILRRSDFSFATIQLESLDTTGASTTTWESGRLEITIDSTWVGELMQFGYESFATNYDDSGRFYDNIDFKEAASIGTNYCASNVNSSGSAAVMSAAGSNVAASNDLTLQASGMPANQFGIFIVSGAQNQIPVGNGFLCLAGTIGRYRGPGEILSTGAAGNFELSIDLTAIPQASGTVSVAAGQTWNFQAWFRDGVGSGSDLTDGYQIDFQ